MIVESATATIDIRELAQEFALSEQDLIVQGVRAFVTEQLRLFRVEKQARCAKFGVNSLEEMDRLITDGLVKEEDILVDFQNVDYLTARVEHLERLETIFHSHVRPLYVLS